MFKRIGNSSLRGDVVVDANIKPNTAVARYLEINGSHMIKRDGEAKTSRYGFPQLICQLNPTVSAGRLYMLSFHPATGKAVQLIEGVTGEDILSNLSDLTESQIRGEYVVRVYELSGQTKL